MLVALRDRLLHVLRVPPEPEPPSGAPGSVRVFRASRRYFQLRLGTWGLRQLGALIGIIAVFGGWAFFDFSYEKPEAAQVIDEAEQNFNEAIEKRFGGAARLLPETGEGWRSLFTVIETVSILGFLLQLPVTFMLVRLDWEMRWYIATDRSLRIREGVRRVREMTLTFANVQDVTVVQGPLQRLFGIADLKVRTAGGGRRAAKAEEGEKEDDAHLGVLRGIENASEVRDLILARLKALRDGGLGDPDDQHLAAPTPDDEDAVTAARALLEESRALRRELAR